MPVRGAPAPTATIDAPFRQENSHLVRTLSVVLHHTHDCLGMHTPPEDAAKPNVFDPRMVSKAAVKPYVHTIDNDVLTASVSATPWRCGVQRRKRQGGQLWGGDGRGERR